MTWYEAFDEKTAVLLPGLTIHREEPMSRHTSFRIGGPARRMAFPETAEQLTALVELADREMGLKNVVFISFSFQNLVYVREVAPNAICQFLTSGEITDELVQKLIEHKMDLDAYHLRLTTELVEKLHAAGLEVNCWTVDDPDRAKVLVDMGVDYITSNILY